METIIDLSPAQILEAYVRIQEGRKLSAVKFIKEQTGCSLRDAKEFADNITEHMNMGKLGHAKIVGDSLEKKNSEIAQEIVGFAIRDIEEPSGYIGVEVESTISQIATYHALVTTGRIIVKKDDKFYAGPYYRFKKDVENPACYKEVMKL